MFIIMKIRNLTNPSCLFKLNIFFIGKPKVCEMTKVSGADDSSDLDGNTILQESEDNEYVYISEFEFFKFKTDDKIIDYTSLLGNNMCPYAIAIGEKNTYFILIHCKLIENDKIEEGNFLSATNDNLDSFIYHLTKCGVDSFKTLERSQIHTFYRHIEEDEEDEDDVLVEENE